MKLIPLILWLSVGVNMPGLAAVKTRPPVSIWTMPKSPHAQTVTLAWDLNPDPAIAFYSLYWGPAQSFYTNRLSPILSTNVTLTNLGVGIFHFSVTDTDTNRLESLFSTEAVWTNLPPAPVTNFLLSVSIQQSGDFTNWTTFTNLGQFQATNSGAPIYWRSLINIQPQ